MAARAAQIALVGIQEEALTGTCTVLDVLVAEQQLFTTQAQLVTAEHDTAIAEFNVAAATGRLVAPELRLPVHLYEIASTPWGLTSTRHHRRCCREFPASATDWRAASSVTARRMVLLAFARR